MSAREIAFIEYASCDLVLEVNATWTDKTTTREIILGALPPELLYDHARAVRHVMPFVEAFKRGDERAVAEVLRALRAQQQHRDWLSKGLLVCYYDPNEHG
jgi:hypothetical protein